MNTSQPEALTSVPFRPPSLWITERMATSSNTLAQPAYKSFNSSSLLRVLMHTTQPAFTGKIEPPKQHPCSYFPLNVALNLHFEVFNIAGERYKYMFLWWIHSWT